MPQDEVGRIVTAQELQNIPEGVFIANWAWKGLITPETFAEKWLTHRDVAVDNLSPYGWIGAGLFQVPQTGSETVVLSLIYYESRESFKRLMDGASPELAAAWKAVVDDLRRFQHPPGHRWVEEYPEGMTFLAGDYLPQA